MSQDKPKVKYRICHINNKLTKGKKEINLENASLRYVISVENAGEVNEVIEREHARGFTFHVKREVPEWGWELYFYPTK